MKVLFRLYEQNLDKEVGERLCRSPRVSVMNFFSPE